MVVLVTTFSIDKENWFLLVDLRFWLHLHQLLLRV